MVAKSKAVVEISLDDKDFKSKSGQATAGLESNMKKVGVAVMGVAAALGAVAAAKGAVDMLTTLTKKAIEVADSFDIIEKQLVTLTKSEEKAKAFFAAIKDFAKDTPYQVKDLAQSFNMLYPVFKDKTLPMLKLIGDTAAGTGRSFQDTGSAMMRMATGDWGIEIMRQLFLVKSEFGDIFGPNGELVGSQEEAFAKLEEIMGDRFGGMMVGMMDTVRGKVSNLKDVLDSLGAVVGSELTPVTKEFLDLLIEVVKQAEESGELQDMARDLADGISENKDLLIDIINMLPDLLSGGLEILRMLGDIVGRLAEINEAWGEWTGNGRTAVEDLGTAVKLLVIGLIGIRELYRDMWEDVQEIGDPTKRGWMPGMEQKWTGKKDEDWLERAATRVEELYGVTREAGGAPGGMRSFAEIGEAPSDIDAEIRKRKAEGQTPEEIMFEARGTRAEAYVERALTAEVARGPAKKPGKAPKMKRGKSELELSFERRKQAEETREALAGLGGYRPAGLAEETTELRKREAEREEERKKEEEEIRALAETYAEWLDPTSYLIAGLKSGEMKQAIQDFAVQLGTKVSEELLRKLIVMGIMAILQVATGGASTVMGPMPMARGGVIKAQGGLTMLPARQGGWTFPWADKWINAAEGGERETLGIFPEGQRGRDLITQELLPYFFPETQMVNRNTFSPNIDVNLRGTDPQSIGIAVRAEQGGANRSHVQRKAA